MNTLDIVLKNRRLTRREYVKRLSPKKRIQYWASWALPVIIIWCLFLFWFNAHYTISLNRSSSLEGSIYLIVKNGQIPDKGGFIAIDPGPTPVYPWRVISIKRIGGVPGDRVSTKHRTFYINGQPIAVAKPVSKRGDPLTLGPVGVLPPNHYWLYTDSPDSYDSRYNDIGWVSKDNIVGPAYVLL